jgi:hypothetical protein
MVATVQDKLRDLVQAFGIKVDEALKEPVPAPSPKPAALEAGTLAQDSVDSLLNQLFNELCLIPQRGKWRSREGRGGSRG